MKTRLTLNSYISLFLACSFYIPSQLAQGQISNDSSFNAGDLGRGYGDGPNGAVRDIVVQPDGKVFVLGDFTTFDGTPRGGLARLKGNSNGLDSSFSVGTGFTGGTGPVEMALQPDGKLVVVGSFTHYNSIVANGVVRLMPNGEIDNTFSVGPGSTQVTNVEIIAPDQILVAGNFPNFAGVNRGLVVRLTNTGSVDLAFDAGVGGLSSGTIKDIAVQSDGKVLVAGQFSGTFNGGSLLLATPTSPAVMLRLKSYGPIDPLYTIIRTSGSYGMVNSVKVVSGDKAILGGKFTSLLGANISSGSSNIGQLYSSGLVDLLSVSIIAAPTQNEIEEICIQGSQIIASGFFRNMAGIKRGRIARFQANGSIDATFAPDSGANNDILSIALDMTGRVLIGGKFTRYDQRGRNYLARLTPLGKIEAPFTINTGADRRVFDIAVQPDRKVLIGGEFGYYNGNFTNSIARMLANGQYDPTFNMGVGINGTVRCIAVQPDGKILLGGLFDSYGTVQRKGLIRLLSNGSLDPGFSTAGTVGTVHSIALQQDGKILVGGDFASFGGFTTGGIIRLNANGANDNTFHPGGGFNGPVHTVAVLRDSIIFVGGNFSTIQGYNRRGIAALSMNGFVNQNFNPGAGVGPTGVVHTIALTRDRKVIIGGEFDQFNHVERKNVARLLTSGALDASFDPGFFAEGPVHDLIVDFLNRVIVVGQFEGKATGRNGIVRLKNSGSKDQTFGGGSGADGGGIYGIDDDPDGGFLIAGDFTAFDDDARNRIARLNDSLITVTTWNGTYWTFGRPDDDPSRILHSVIDGHYSNANAGYVCDDLFINSGMLFEPNTDVEVRGNALSNSTQTGGRIVMNSTTGMQSFEGYANHLTIDNTLNVSLNGPTWLKGTLKLQSGYLATNDELTLVSNAAGTARVATVEPGAGITGEVTVQRYVSAPAPAWHFMSTPIEFPVQTQADWEDDFTILNNNLFSYNEAATLNSGQQVNGWEYFDGNISHGRGYRVWLNQNFVNGSSTFDNKGSLFTGTFNFPIAYTPGGYNGGGWNLIANPFACEVDWDLVHPSQAASINGEIHFWNADHYGSYAGGVGVNGGVRYIPSHQGFFVRATGPGASLSFPESAKPATPQANSMLRVAALPDDACRIRLTGPNGKSDELVVRIMENATNGFDAALDAHKFLNPGLNLYSMMDEGTTKASIQAVPLQEEIRFPLGYSVSGAGEYEMGIEMGNQFAGTHSWFLEDNFSGTLQPVNASHIIPMQFAANALGSTQRFRLVGYSSVTETPTLIEKGQPMVSHSNEQVRIWNATEVASVRITDMMGRQVAQVANAKQPTLEIPTGLLAPGAYQVQVISSSGTFTDRILKY